MQPLVTADWLLDHPGDPEVVALEASSEADPGARYFREGHIPEARFAWWKTVRWTPPIGSFQPPTRSRAG